MDALLISLISACTALVASIVGPIITLTVAKRQINATVLSANRQKWIESLRDALAELISLLVAALVVKSKWKDKWEKGRGALESDPALIEKLQRIVHTQCKIRLMLNPAETDHEHLAEAFERAFRRLQSEESLDAEIESDIEIITKLAQGILRREWQRVKRGV